MTLSRRKVITGLLYLLVSTSILIGSLLALDRQLREPYWPAAAEALRSDAELSVPVALPKSAMIELRHFEGLPALAGPPPADARPPVLLLVPGPAPRAAEIRPFTALYEEAHPLGPPALGILRLERLRPRGGRR